MLCETIKRRYVGNVRNIAMLLNSFAPNLPCRKSILLLPRHANYMATVPIEFELTSLYVIVQF